MEQILILCCVCINQILFCQEYVEKTQSDRCTQFWRKGCCLSSLLFSLYFGILVFLCVCVLFLGIVWIQDKLRGLIIGKLKCVVNIINTITFHSISHRNYFQIVFMNWWTYFFLSESSLGTLNWNETCHNFSPLKWMKVYFFI